MIIGGAYGVSEEIENKGRFNTISITANFPS